MSFRRLPNAVLHDEFERRILYFEKDIFMLMFKWQFSTPVSKDYFFFKVVRPLSPLRSFLFFSNNFKE